MVSTFVTDGDYHDLMAGANATLGLFGQSLQLSGGVSYCRQWVTGVNSACHDFVRSSLSVSYSLGSLHSLRNSSHGSQSCTTPTSLKSHRATGLPCLVAAQRALHGAGLPQPV